MTRPPRWGRVADAEPRAILLLRALQDALDPRGAPGARLAQDEALAELARILEAWDESESISELRRALDVSPAGRRRNDRRKLRTVRNEMQLLDRLISAALAGVDCSTYRRAADALGDVDEKRIERVWREWGDLRASSMRAMCSIWPAQAENIHRALTRLPALPD